MVFNNNGVYRGNDVNPTGGRDPSPLVFVKGARYDKMMEAFGGVGVHATTPDELRSAMEQAIRSRQADPDQRGHRRDGRHRERPHHQPQSDREEESVTAWFERVEDDFRNDWSRELDTARNANR